MVQPGWLPMNEVLARVVKLRGGADLAIRELNHALLTGDAKSLERAVAVKGDGYKERELPKDFWQAAKLSCIYDAGAPRLFVRHKGREPGFTYHYFVRQSDVERLWPLANEQGGLTSDTQQAQSSAPGRRKSPAGAKGDYNWDENITEAAGHMYETSVPKSLADLCDHIEQWCGVDDAPSETQLKKHLRSLYERFKKADSK